MSELQGLACGAGGTIGGGSAMVYSLEMAATVTSPELLLPLIAAGFSTGCGVGASLAPALTWLYRHS